MILRKFLKPVLLTILLLSPMQQMFALDQSRIYKFAGGVFTAALSVNLVRYCNNKIDSLENLLEELDDDSDETREERVAQEKKIKRYKFAKYLSLAAVLAAGIYAGKQAWEIWQELSGGGGDQQSCRTFVGRVSEPAPLFTGSRCTFGMHTEGLFPREDAFVYSVGLDGKNLLTRKVVVPDDFKTRYPLQGFPETVMIRIVREKLGENTIDSNAITRAFLDTESELDFSCPADEEMEVEEID